MTAAPAAMSREQAIPIRHARRRRDRDRLTAVLVVLPSIVATAIFVYGFIGWTVRVSLSKWTGLNPDYTFVGLQQYLRLARDPRFAIDVRNTLVFTVLFLTSCIVLGLLLAILLDQRLRGENVLRSIFLFPMAISFIVTGVAWRWLMNSATGDRISGLNLLFHQLGLDALINNWHLTNPPWGIAFIALPAVWQMSGFTMALYLGGLRAISDDLREAARVDGASEWTVFWRIIMPIILPTVTVVVTTMVINVLKLFDLVYVMTGGNFKTDVIANRMYTEINTNYNVGRGTAVAVILVLAIIPFVYFNIRRFLAQESMR
jgi:glucose/mannose transport system permease protein